MHAISRHGPFRGGRRTDLDPGRGDERLGARAPVGLIGPERLGRGLGPLGSLRPVLQIEILDPREGQRRLTP